MGEYWLNCLRLFDETFHACLVISSLYISGGEDTIHW